MLHLFFIIAVNGAKTITGIKQNLLLSIVIIKTLYLESSIWRFNLGTPSVTIDYDKLYLMLHLVH